MITFFRFCCLIALASFIGHGLLQRHDGHAVSNPAAAVSVNLMAQGYAVATQKNALWGVPALTVSVAGCPAPINVLVFDFDEVASPGIVPAILSVEHGSLQVSYRGENFETFDRAALYRLRLGDVIRAFSDSDILDRPVILSFWSPSCAPRAIF